MRLTYLPGSDVYVNDRDFVEELRAKGYEIWDGHYPSSPELNKLELLNMHRDSDRATMRHVRFRHFMDNQRYYFRKDNPETMHRFYVVVSVNDPEATALMYKISMDRL
jgi:hypothetical protein